MIQEYACKPNNLEDLHTQTRGPFQHIVRKKKISYFTTLEAQVYCLSLRQGSKRVWKMINERQLDLISGLA